MQSEDKIVVGPDDITTTEEDGRTYAWVDGICIPVAKPEEAVVGVDRVPPVDPLFKLTPFFRANLSDFAQLVNAQLGLRVEGQTVVQQGRAKGLTMIVGPRGTGKNKLVEQYAAIAGRPLFRYACSPDKEERDLTYDVELHNGEVVRVPTRILVALQTEGALLELDEVNLLRPSVAKFFNALFDDDRALFLNDQVIHAADDVLFVGLMNPADYNGVEDLPDTIDDRASVMQMGYPPLLVTDDETGQDLFTPDEAIILKEEVPLLADYTDEQFARIWNRVVNGIGAVDVPAEVAQVVKDLKTIVLVAHRTRQTVEAYKTRASDARMERDISLRGSIKAARYYAENELWAKNVKKLPGWKDPWTAAHYAVARTYLPHTQTYRRGHQDQEAIERILAEGIR